jgi:hypothetical protein
MEPLSFTYDSPLKQDTPHVLLHSREYSTRLLVPEEESSVVLEFSEPMQQNLPATYNNKHVEAEWINDTRLRIELKEMDMAEFGIKEVLLRLDALYAKSGNYLEFSSLIIRKIPQYEWHQLSTGHRIGFSTRDRFYDQIIMADNEQSYVGIVKLGGSMGDGDGTSYAFILERKGLEPVIVEHVFYSTIEPGDLPIQWIDNDTLLYSSYFGVYTYNINEGKKNTLHEIVGDEKQMQLTTQMKKLFIYWPIQIEMKPIS